jgi:hypothetical protein
MQIGLHQQAFHRRCSVAVQLRQNSEALSAEAFHIAGKDSVRRSRLDNDDRSRSRPTEDSAMFPAPFNVDPKWYENYWYSVRPRPKRRTFRRSLARFGALVALLAGSSVLLSQLYP